ncbi:hypothetical protein [Streptomyces sp. NBC_01262]|uniref:hypothetical protein n=1 Tax=Streptomyces sp. NBC_01262 TaxID=2903803 RepID=UPI002E381B45|nr:hypothetical protein [Streptomyces sp. NBC_01262]
MALPLLAFTCLLLVTLGYAGMCAAVPFKDCRHCRGFGFAMRTDRKGRTKRGKDCRKCRATGKRIRVGRHLWNLWRGVHRAGTR